DLVEGITRLMRCDAHDPVNLGNPDERTILELAESILKCCNGTMSKIVFSPLPVDDPKQRRPDLTKAKRLLDWQPRVSFGEGLERTLAWFRQYPNIKR
ncbi:MAG: SDR family NAD-dependent epimerase/dehydratase, partial [Candidatus Omnitrophica bacterium]|nr:SDR family NAD-dependent epimerase/dehydratase [Candidatus Omnitrophota bacterium]